MGARSAAIRVDQSIASRQLAGPPSVGPLLSSDRNAPSVLDNPHAVPFLEVFVSSRTREHIPSSTMSGSHGGRLSDALADQPY